MAFFEQRYVDSLRNILESCEEFYLLLLRAISIPECIRVRVCDNMRSYSKLPVEKGALSRDLYSSGRLLEKHRGLAEMVAENLEASCDIYLGSDLSQCRSSPSD